MSRKQTLAAIDRVFREMNGPQHGFDTVRDKLFAMNVKAEREHRKGAWSRGSHGLTVPQAARLFTVQHIAEGLDKPDRWAVKDVPYIRLEAIMGQAYACEYRAEFLAAFERAGVTVAEALSWDYAELAA